MEKEIKPQINADARRSIRVHLRSSAVNTSFHRGGRAHHCKRRRNPGLAIGDLYDRPGPCVQFVTESIPYYG